MVKWENRKFYIDGKETKIYSGSIHYFRSFPQRWRELLWKLKCCGMNTVETYCCWNLHEENPGKFDFTGRLDIERFLKTAEELGLYVILRPGPYICAEWDNGGIPAWLLKDENTRLRTDEGPYLAYVRRYFDKLIPKIIPHLQTNGGSIIMVAAENEYGSFGNSTVYMNNCADMIRSYGVDVPLVTSDGQMDNFITGGHADGCLPTLDFGYDKGVLTPEYGEGLWRHNPDAPFMHMEHWVGMFQHWGQPAQKYKAEYVAEEIRKQLELGYNFNMYMFHGGTNFGFMNGANDFFKDPDNKLRTIHYSDITSYDYDAPLTEWGEITPKYLAIQKEMSKHLGVELPVPEPVPVQNLGDVKLTQCADLFDNLANIGERYQSSCIHHMEYYDQNYGYILYRTHLPKYRGVKLMVFSGLSDRVNVYFNGVWRGTVDRNDKETCLVVDGWMDEGGVLDLLVENMGRSNFSTPMNRGDRKGILNHVWIRTDGPSQILYNWEVYTLPMKTLDKLNYGDVKMEHPAFYKGHFHADEKIDCFIHMDNFTKGFVVVNGFNLGRYWEIGPQKSLYLPGLLLQEENEIIVFAEKPTDHPAISIRDYHILDAERTEEGPVTIV